MMRRLPTWLLVTLVATATPAFVGWSAAPVDAAPDAGARVRKQLELGQDFFADMEYKEAIRVLLPVTRAGAATRAQRLRAYELIGQSYLILGDKSRARAAFEELLAIDSGYQLREATESPKIRDFFAAVKRDYVPDSVAASAELEHSAPPSATGGRRVELEVVVKHGAEEVKGIAAVVRRRGVLAYTRSVALRRIGDRRWRARFRAPASAEPYVLEYYIEARDLGGRSVGRVAGPETPLSFPVDAGGTRRSWYRRWYAVAGATALVGIGAALLVTSGDSAPTGSLQPGRVTVTP